MEIDKSNRSLNKRPINAAFNVGEAWSYDGRHQRTPIYEFQDGAYAEIPAGRLFRLLARSVLREFIQQSRTQGQTAALAAFREWIRSKK